MLVHVFCNLLWMTLFISCLQTRLCTNFICTSGRTSLSTMAGNTKVQEIEVSAIKAEFDGTCRIIKDLGEFTHVLTLQPSGKDIIYKFQMTGTYIDSILIFFINHKSFMYPLTIMLCI